MVAKEIAVMEYLPYGPDLASCDFLLITRIKSTHYRNKLENKGKLKQSGLGYLNSKSKQLFLEYYTSCWINQI